MKERMIKWLIGMILSRLDEKSIETWVVNQLNTLEESVLSSKNKWDDLTVLPMIALVRSTFNLPVK